MPSGPKVRRGQEEKVKRKKQKGFSAVFPLSQIKWMAWKIYYI